MFLIPAFICNKKNVGMKILTEPPIVTCFQDLDVFNDIISGGIFFFGGGGATLDRILNSQYWREQAGALTGDCWHVWNVSVFCGPSG